ncbi:hypothetical protein NW765_006687 [Fusarium oxysporum]|nr:hypothetical protein NW765_006687 [Fusarium oxysporum]
MRVPYMPNPPLTSSPEEEAIVAAIAARHHPRPIQPLDLALLHSPHVAAGWNTFVGAIRTKTSLADDLRELAIYRIAVVNRAWYEWMHHEPLAVNSGVSSESMNEIMKEGVKDETFEWFKSLASDQKVIEVVATVACYNCVSRFLVALDVGERNNTVPEPLPKQL